MARNFLRPFTFFGTLFMAFLCAANSQANSQMSEVTNVLEEVRIIDILSESNPSFTTYKKSKGPEVPSSPHNLGIVLYEQADCTKCVKHNLSYDQATKLFNPFGAEKPIEELVSWSGSRAQITYRMTNYHIVEIKILP